MVCKWLDQICVTNLSATPGRCGNNVGVSYYLRWWHSPPTQKQVAEQTIYFSICPLFHSHSTKQQHGFSSATLLHFSHSEFNVVVVCCLVSDAKDLIWAARTFRWHICRNPIPITSPHLHVVWIRFSKFTFHVVFCCPDFLQSIWIRCLCWFTPNSKCADVSWLVCTDHVYGSMYFTPNFLLFYISLYFYEVDS